MMKSNEVAEKHFLLAETYQQKGNFPAALENYNFCLCNAPAESTFIRASFVNRAKIYYKVKEYQRALDNLTWAQQIKSFTANGCGDLLEMVRACNEEILRTPMRPNAMDIFKVSLPVNEKVPFVSACLELKKNEIYGRYFITTKDINPGEVIVAEEPFFKVIDSKVSHQRCCICCSANMYSLTPCGSCCQAMFCSNECKNSTIHGCECTASGNRTDTLEEQLLQRMFYQSIDVCGSLDQLKSLVSSAATAKTILDYDFADTTAEVKKKKIIQSVTGLDKRDPVTRDAYSRFKKVIERLISETDDATDDFLNDYLISCLQSLTVNFFHFQWDASGDAAAKGLVLCALSAFFSHSCDPNMEKIDVDNKFIFIARKPIKAGEQLNMCYDRYNFLNYSLDDRQRYLQTVYKFTCNCVACVNNYGNYAFNFNDLHLKIDEASEKYRKNCEFIRENMHAYPCESICRVVQENVVLLSFIGNGLPF